MDFHKDQTSDFPTDIRQVEYHPTTPDVENICFPFFTPHSQVFLIRVYSSCSNTALNSELVYIDRLLFNTPLPYQILRIDSNKNPINIIPIRIRTGQYIYQLALFSRLHEHVFCFFVGDCGDHGFAVAVG